jgi:hypothetical protein
MIQEEKKVLSNVARQNESTRHEKVVGARCGGFGPEAMMTISLSMAFNS